MTKNNRIEKLIRPCLATFRGYSPCKSPDTLAGKIEVPAANVIKLDANENPFGCSPKVQQALSTCDNINIYPDAAQTELRNLLAKYTGIEAEHIIASNGSDQLIDLILRLFIESGDEVINCVPTFDMFRFSTKLCNGCLVEAPRDVHYGVDANRVKSLVNKKTKIIFLANPNNPTGTITPQSDILKILDTGLPIVIDEAYYEFSGETMLPYFKSYDNLIVLRTFSKWAGLAGLRIGYGIFPQEIASYLMRIKHPYSVNVAALIAVRESLKDIDLIMERVKAITEERERLFQELKTMKWLKPFPTKTNFVFCSVLSGKASDLQKKLQKKGILVRTFDQPLLKNSIRFSVGKPKHTDALIRALRLIKT